MKIIEIDVNNKEHYQKLRKDIGHFLFTKRQKRNMSLARVAGCTKLKPEQIDEIEIGRCSLQIGSIIRLLGIYKSEIKLSFVTQEDNPKKVPVLELL